MNPARTLKRSALLGLTALLLTIGSTFTQPAATASVATLPGSHTGSADTGYYSPFPPCWEPWWC